MVDKLLITIKENGSIIANSNVLFMEGENESKSIVANLPKKFIDKWFYIEFSRSDGEKFTSKRLTPTEKEEFLEIIYLLKKEILNCSGFLKIQFVVKDENGVIWKSDTAIFTVKSSINATEELVENKTAQDLLLDVQTQLDGKQDKLTAGRNIEIEETENGVVISAVGSAGFITVEEADEIISNKVAPAIDNSQTALDNANASLENSQYALEKSLLAKEESTIATTTANTAIVNSETANEIARTALENSQNANQTAQTAIEVANQANTSANLSLEKSVNAEEIANEAKHLVDQLDDIANSGLELANTAFNLSKETNELGEINKENIFNLENIVEKSNKLIDGTATIFTLNVETEFTFSFEKTGFQGLEKDFGFGVITNEDLHTFPVGKYDVKVYNATSIKDVFNGVNIKLTNIGRYLQSIKIGDLVENIPLYGFAGCTQLKEIKIGKGVTYIGQKAFSNCTSLETIEIPNNVKTGLEDTFYGCDNLKTAVIGSGVSYIDSAFRNCPNLENVIFDEGSELFSVSKYSFDGCESIKRIVLPKYTEKIERYAFSNCTNLIEVIIPSLYKKTVEGIDGYAFYNCPNLDYIFVGEKINIIKENSFLSGKRIEFKSKTPLQIYDNKNPFGEQVEQIIVPNGCVQAYKNAWETAIGENINKIVSIVYTNEFEQSIQEIKESKQDNLSFDGEYDKTTNKVATVKTVTDKISQVIANAPESYDTLAEIAAWIAEHPESVAELNQLISKNAENIAKNTSDIAEVVAGDKQFDKVSVSGVDDSPTEYYSNYIFVNKRNRLFYPNKIGTIALDEDLQNLKDGTEAVALATKAITDNQGNVIHETYETIATAIQQHEILTGLISSKTPNTDFNALIEAIAETMPKVVRNF